MTVDQILIAMRQAGTNAYSWSLPRREAEVLVAEVERLRDTVAFLRASVPPTHPSDYGHEAWAETVRAEVAAERGAVVAWLREIGNESYVRPDAWAILSAAADCIESGGHRREEAT